MSNAKISWLLFIAIGAAMGIVRYMNMVDPVYTSLLIQYGPYAIIGIHVILVLMAFGDTVYQGVLCVIIPFYSFYWLFFVSDAFYMRAIVGGLLVGIAKDSAIFYQKYFTEGISHIQGWIQKGGS